MYAGAEAIVWDRLQPGKRQAPRRKDAGDFTGLFPAKAGPTKPREVSEIERELDCGTGFSRESVRGHAAKMSVISLASSRLKPVLRTA